MPEHRTPVYLRGIRHYVPETVLTNDDLARRVDTSDEWIVTRTGIRERRIAAEGESCSDMALASAHRTLEAAGLEPADIDLIIVATITPDMVFPSTACILQAKLGLNHIPCMDVEAACTGFLYMMDMARGLLVANPRYRNILIIGAEKLSSIIDWSDRATCVLFGDGAGSAVLSREGPGFEIGDMLLGADGSNPGLLCLPAGGSDEPANADSVQGGRHFLKMNGREVFKFASRVMAQASLKILAANKMTVDDVDMIIPHQANIRIIESACKSMKTPIEKFYVNLHRYGNTSAASVPIAFSEAVEEGRIRPGDRVLLVAFGAGLTYGATILNWRTSP